MTHPNRLSALVLRVADLDRAAELYRTAFGLELHVSDHRGGEHGADDPWTSGRHAAITWDGDADIHFALYEAEDAPTAGAALSFRVENLDDAHSTAVAAGAHVLHEPRPEPWGRSARYLDLDGNTVELTQPNSR